MRCKDCDKDVAGLDFCACIGAGEQKEIDAKLLEIKKLTESNERWRTRATLAETVVVATRKDVESYMESTYDALEAYDKARPYKDLGWANSWKETPQEAIDCRAADHDTSDIDIGPPNRGIQHIVRCELCRIVHRYDSSD